MNDIQILACRAAIDKMMRSGWVDITCIDKVLAMMKRVPDREEYEILHMLHCVNFKDMDPELRRGLPLLLARVLESERVDYVFGGEVCRLIDR